MAGILFTFNSATVTAICCSRGNERSLRVKFTTIKNLPRNCNYVFVLMVFIVVCGVIYECYIVLSLADY